jgi:hypothetical protein
MEKNVIEDGYRRAAFLDRLVPGNFTLRDARENRFAGSRFCGNESYQVVEIDKVQKKARFRLLPRADQPYGSLELEKQYQLKQEVLTLHYSLTNRGGQSREFKFIPQVDFSFPGYGESFLRIFAVSAGEKAAIPREGGEFGAISALEFQDLKNETIINLLSDKPFELWLIPIHTRCRINGEMTEVYQSLCSMPVHAVSLEPGGRFDVVYRLKINH